MLMMKEACEACGAGTPPDDDGVYICSFECTFCGPCAEGPLAHSCPNCRGLLVARPPRTGEALRRHKPEAEPA